MAIKMYRKFAIVIQQRHKRSPGHLGFYTLKVFGVSYLFTRPAVQREREVDGSPIDVDSRRYCRSRD